MAGYAEGIMIIALDGSDLTSSNVDGTTIYARNLIPLLAELLCNLGVNVDLYVTDYPDIVLPSGINVKTIPRSRFWTQTALSRSLFRAKPDCIFLPIQTMPLYRPKHLRVVAVIHDLDFLTYPNMYTLQNRLLLRWFTRAVARNATRIIAVSETTKQSIIRAYGRDENDITVIHHGVDNELFRLPVSDQEYDREVRRVQGVYNIPPNHLLFVGAMQPRKNIAGLVTAFESLRAQNEADRLVLVCGGGWQEENILARIRKSPERNAISLLQKVPVKDIRALYWNASVFILPSFAEGFGMPVVEAMACGAPVVISDTPALREIAGSAAEVADPKDPDSIATAIRTICSDEDRRAVLRAKGLARASQFSWSKAAEQTVHTIIDSLK